LVVTLGSRRLVEGLVDLLAEFRVLVLRRLLHPEEEPPLGAFPLEKVDASCRALLDSLEHSLLGENDQVLFVSTRGSNESSEERGNVKCCVSLEVDDFKKSSHIYEMEQTVSTWPVDLSFHLK